MLAFKNRFHGHGSLRYVYKNGNAVRTRLLTLKYTSNPHRKQPRVAIVVSKKIYKRAVGRNRIRRRLYEAIRQELSAIAPNSDLAVIVSSSEILTMPYTEIIATVKQVISSAGLYKKEP